MASPQKENGFISVANEIFEQLVKVRLLGAEWDVCIWIIRKTYGFNKKKDWISLSQFQEATGLSRPTVVKTLKNLVARNIIIKKDKQCQFNKDWETWVVKAPLLVKAPYTTGKGVFTKTGKGALTHKRQYTYITKDKQKTNLIKIQELKTKAINSIKSI